MLSRKKMKIDLNAHGTHHGWDPIYYLGSYRNLSEFEASTESWSMYMERLEQFFVTNKITDKNWQHAIFLIIIRLNIYTLIWNLLFLVTSHFSVEDVKSTYKQILYSHYDLITPEIVVYYKFYTRI